MAILGKVGSFVTESSHGRRRARKKVQCFISANTIGQLTQLRVLSLRSNRLSGQIPLDFSNLKSRTGVGGLEGKN
ncbi:hypothetical protein U1Q18_031057, partial [Sarracenia purpurea var. burkii]